MTTNLSYHRTLGPISSHFVNELLNCGKSIFTLDDAMQVYGHNRHKTSKFLSDLTKRNILFRIKSGVFLILQMGQENVQLSNWPLIAHTLAIPDDYYISHYSAMRLHGMTTHPLVDIYITMTKRHVKKKINNFTYHFIYSKPEYFWGGYNHWVTKQDKIWVSNIERTLLDGLARPDLCGGIKEVFRGIWIKQKEINWEKMVRYAEKSHTKASVKRLGFILEMLDLSPDYLPLLKKIVLPAKDYILLDPNGPKEGQYLSRWHLQLNINTEELKAGVWE